MGDKHRPLGYNKEPEGRPAWHRLRWNLSADDPGQDFWFPDFVLQPGQECRVYTNEDHPESCGFNFHYTRSAIWANKGECGHLYDPSGAEVSTYCY